MDARPKVDTSIFHSESEDRYGQANFVSKIFWLFWEQQLDRRHKGCKPRLWASLIKLVFFNHLYYAIVGLVEIVIQITQAILVGLLAEYFVGELTTENTRNAYLYAMGITLCTFIVPFLHSHALYEGQNAGMIVRIALTGTIYKKIFGLSMETIGETTIGKIVNLASSDVQRIENV
jgi:ATP-binding cassette subfamily C (CFTR/MRP) protein 4